MTKERTAAEIAADLCIEIESMPEPTVEEFEPGDKFVTLRYFSVTNMHAAYAAGAASRDGEVEALQRHIESAANFMRGVCMDPAVPKHARGALWSMVKVLDESIAAEAAK